MTLTSKKYERIYSKTGSDADLISTDDFNDMKDDFDNNHYLNDIGQRKILGPVLYQIQQMQDEIDYLRTEIALNKSKTTFPGLGTTSTTALAGDKIYKKITSETTEDLIVINTDNNIATGGVSKMLIANYSDSNEVTIDVFLEDATASASTNASNNKYYFINKMVLPVGVSLVLEDNMPFDDSVYNLRITTVGTSPLVSVIIK
jgi:hypothetical protein